MRGQSINYGLYTVFAKDEKQLNLGDNNIRLNLFFLIVSSRAILFDF